MSGRQNVLFPKNNFDERAVRVGETIVAKTRIRLNKMLVSTLRAAGHPEVEFWRAYPDEAIVSDLLKKSSYTKTNRYLTSHATQI